MSTCYYYLPRSYEGSKNAGHVHLGGLHLKKSWYGMSLGNKVILIFRLGLIVVVISSKRVRVRFRSCIRFRFSLSILV